MQKRGGKIKRKILIVFSCLILSSCEEQNPTNEIILESIKSYPGICACPFSVKKNGDLCGDNSAYAKQKVLKVMCYETDLAKLENSIKTITSSITKSVKITDGDSIKIGNNRIRLQGIDAPELKQKCKKKNQEYNCGADSKKFLKFLIKDSDLTCKYKELDRYNRILGMCFVKGMNINEQMVENGWALAYRKYNKIFIENENNAKKNLRGIWGGDFEKPWDWRKKN